MAPAEAMEVDAQVATATTTPKIEKVRYVTCVLRDLGAIVTCQVKYLFKGWAFFQ